MRVVMLFALVACAAPPLPAPGDGPAQLPADRTRHYTIWLGGGRVGTAHETEEWSRRGVHLHRDEVMRFLRGDADVELVTAIDIDADPALVAYRVRWSQTSGRDVRRVEAIRTAGDPAWHSSDPSIAIVANGVPAELAPLIVRRDGRFRGPVFLPARDFVGGEGRIDPVGGDAPRRLIARLALTAGPLAEATIDLDGDGMPARVVDGDGVIAIRATAEQARAEFPAIDLVAATAVPIAGTRRSPHVLELEGDLALPPIPGQAARTSATGISIELGSHLTGAMPAGELGRDRGDEIRALVAAVHERITPDLAASAGSPRDADAATAGDCTTFALAYAALASRRGIPTRVVTGLRVDGDRLVRHRWAVSWTGRAWIAVDAAFGAAPAGGDLVGLAVGDADDTGMVAGEAALTRVRAATWN